MDVGNIKLFGINSVFDGKTLEAFRKHAFMQNKYYY